MLLELYYKIGREPPRRLILLQYFQGALPFLKDVLIRY